MPTTLNFDEDTKQRYIQAIKAGIDSKVAIKAASSYQSQKNIVNLGNESERFKADAKRYGGGTLGGAARFTAFDPESSANLTKVAPLVIGAGLAPFTGGLSLAGVAGLTGLGTAGAELARQAGNKENVNLGTSLKEGAYAGGGTYAGGLVFNKIAGLVGKAVGNTGIGTASRKVGDFLSKDIKDVRFGGSPPPAAPVLENPAMPKPIPGQPTPPPTLENPAAGTVAPKPNQVTKLGNNAQKAQAREEFAEIIKNKLQMRAAGTVAPKPNQVTKLGNPAAGTVAPKPNQVTKLGNNMRAAGTVAPKPNQVTKLGNNMRAAGTVAPKPNQVTKLGNNMRADINNPQVKASPTGYTKETGLNEHINEMLGIGSAGQKYQRMPAKMKELQMELGTSLGSSGATNDAAALKAAAKKAIIKAPGFTKIGTEGKRFQEEIRKVSETIDKYAKDGVISAADHYELQKEIAGQAGTAFKKNAPNWEGADMTVDERANHTAWKVLRKQLGDANPKINPTLSKEQALIEASPGLKARSNAEQKENLRVFGVKLINVGPVKGFAKDAIGARLQKAGANISAAGTRAPMNPTTILAAAQSGSQSVGETALPATTDAVFPSSPDVTGGVGTSQPTPDSPFADPKFVQYLMMIDAQKTGGKNLGTIKALAELAKPSASDKKTEVQVARDDAAFLASDALDFLNNNKNIKTGFVNAPLEGLAAKFGKADPTTLEFNTKISQLKAVIAKSRAGTSFTPNEQKLLDLYTATVGDSLQQIKTKLKGVVQFYAQRPNAGSPSAFVLPADTSQVTF